MSQNRFVKSFKNLLSHLTLFDWLSICLVLGLIIFIGLFLFRRMEWIAVEVKVAPADIFWSERNPPFWLANSISIGDSELDGFGRKMVEVQDVRTFEAQGEKKIVYIKLKLQAVKDKRKNQYVFRSKPLVVGSSIDLRLSRAYLSGLVKYVEGVPDTRIWEDKIVEARAIDWSAKFPDTVGIFPWRAEAIKVGDKMQDSQGRVVAEILDKKVEPAEKIVTTSDGRTFVQPDPIKKDVTLRLKISTVKQEGVNYFLDEFKVKVSSSIPLHLPEIEIWPEITKIDVQ